MTCVLLTWIVSCNCVHGYMHFGKLKFVFFVLHLGCPMFCGAAISALIHFVVRHAELAKYRAAGDNNMTDLQHHVEFFDKNKDGIITFNESYQCALLFTCVT